MVVFDKSCVDGLGLEHCSFHATQAAITPHAPGMPLLQQRRAPVAAARSCTNAPVEGVMNESSVTKTQRTNAHQND